MHPIRVDAHIDIQINKHTNTHNTLTYTCIGVRVYLYICRASVGVCDNNEFHSELRTKSMNVYGVCVVYQATVNGSRI